MYISSGVNLLFEHSPIRLSEIDYYEIFSRPTTFCKISFAVILSYVPMLGVFYADMEEYKHSDCFSKTK